MRKPLFWVLVLAAGLLVPTAFAQFGQNNLQRPNDSSGVRIRQGTHLEWQRAMTAGENGSWYFAWSDTRNGLRGLYMGKVDAAGNLLWTTTVNDGPGRQEDPVLQMVEGGCVIAWIDYRFDAQGGAVYAQKITTTGQRAWTANQSDSTSAVVVAEANNIQINLRILPDGGTGGVLLFWEDFRRGLSADIWGTRLLSNGQLAPGFRSNGTPVAVAAASQPYNGEYTVDIDNRGGAWIAWVDNRTSGDPNVYIQRMRANGTLQFDSTGHALITAPGEQAKLKLAPDGRGGAFLAWRNTPPGEQNPELFMQRIDSLGAARWAPADSGVALTNVEGDQVNPRIVYSAVDTCIVAWEDFRTDPSANSNEDIYINKVTGSNSINRLWGTNGAPVCVLPSHQREMRLASDGHGGAIVVWEDERVASTPEQDSYAQRIGSNGQPLWIANGKSITDSLSIGGQIQPLCRENGNHLLFMWSDTRLGSLPIYRTTW
ncbi:MAG: hypothetical protein OEM52_14325, partial [bacterium]|nr:hypothetical protein [bacterium]